MSAAEAGGGGPYLSEGLARFAAELRYDALPAGVVAAAKRLLLDTLGCALGALDCPPVVLVERTLPRAAERVATVIGSGRRTSAEHAALINGVLVRYLDFMDVYEARDICHPAENIPVALACVEAAGGSGCDLVEAIVVGYEGQLRLADGFSFQDFSMHHVSAGGFVVPMIAGKAWKVRPAQLAHAIALSGVRHLTLRSLSSGKLSMAKAIGYPLSAMEGLFATRLAAGGFTGPVAAMDWMGARVPGARPPAVDLALDGWRIEHVAIKHYPVQFELQSAVELALRLRARLPNGGADVDRVEVVAAPRAAGRTADPAKYRPDNRETADHSLPVCVAMALLDGRVAVDQFRADRWCAPDVLELARRVQVAPSEAIDRRAPRGRPIDMRIVTRSGETHADSIDYPPGDARNPLDDAAIRAKFRGLAEPVLGAARATRVIRAVESIETLADLGSLMRLLRRPKGSPGGAAR